jgi:hypothetical protein
MSKKEDEDKILLSYTNLSEAIRFFLHQSFRHIEHEIRYYIASEIYSDKLKNIDTTEEDKKVVSEFSGKILTTLDLIRFDGNPISENTLMRLTIAWNEAQEEAELTNLRFPVTQELKGPDLMGHVTNFAFVVEILVNRHLFIMNLHGDIDNFTFNSLDKVSVVNKILYLYKTEIKEKKIRPDRISNLFKLRNLAVHFTRDNSQRFKTTIQELVEIWKESGKLMELMETKENIKDNNFYSILSELKNHFVLNFTLSKSSNPTKKNV